MSEDMPTHSHNMGEGCFAGDCPAWGHTAAWYPLGQKIETKPALRPKTSAERKAEPIHSGVMLYFPDALAAVARVSLAGNQKHNPGQALHWARGKSTDQLDATARHLLTPTAIDPETGEQELAQAAWRALAELQLQQERLLAAKGIMPYSGIVPAAEPQDGKG